MRKIFGLLAGVLLFYTTEGHAHDIAETMNDVLPAITYIQVENFTKKDTLDPLSKELIKVQTPNRPIVGTGFIIDDNNVVTNYHVISFAVQNNTDIFVSFQDNNQKYKAIILGYDKVADVALLEIKGKHPSVKIDGDINLRMGDQVFSISHFYGIGWSGTYGVISSGKRTDPRYPYINNLQVQLLQGSGSSGGPVFNAEGNVIGLNRSIVSMFPRTNLMKGRTSMLSMVGYPIRGDTLAESIEAIRRDMIVIRVDLGVSLIAFGPNSLFHLNYTSNEGDFAYGTMVMELDKTKDTALKQSDVIISVEGKEFTDPAKLLLWLNDSGYKAGTVINVQVYRDGEIINIAVELELVGL